MAPAGAGPSRIPGGSVLRPPSDPIRPALVALRRPRSRLAAVGPVFVAPLHLLAVLVPGEPRLFGVPAGIVAQLLVVAASTTALWRAGRVLLPEAAGRAAESDARPSREALVPGASEDDEAAATGEP